MTNVESALHTEEWELVLKSRRLNDAHRNDFYGCANAVIDAFWKNEHGGGRTAEEENRIDVKRHENVAVVHCQAWRHAGKE